jgi:rare lipoprotein A
MSSTGRWAASGRTAGIGFLVLTLVAGCEGTGLGNVLGLQAGDGAAPPATATADLAPGATVERDVEAPEIFQVTESGLWDGRPSLGGVWVAHPDVTDPERVIIRNTANGQFVIGALFRRERDNPGPALQVSSDAAEALGMLAGAPADLNVTALRRQEAPAAPPDDLAPPDGLPPDTATAATDDLTVSPDITATPLDPIAGAAAAIDAAEAAADTAVEPAAVAPVVLETPAPAPVASDLSRPFIQIGIFSIQANADGAAADFDAMGLPTRVVEGATQGRTFWRVLVGPATTEAERAGYLDRVKAAGFADAYFTDN